MLAAAWLCGIFYLSHESTPLGVTANNIGAIAAHLGLYTGPALLPYWALGGGAGTHAEAPAAVLAALGFALDGALRRTR